MRSARTANLLVISLLITCVASQSYTNHTVGDSAGWLFNTSTNTTSANYSKWASTQVFNLGDFLNALDTDTFVYSGGNEINVPLTLAVALTSEVTNYFFSDADDGVQCAQGMAFEISVKHGLGLPPSLNQPPPPPYAEPTVPSTVPKDQAEQFYNRGSRDSFNLRLGVFVLGLLMLM
ncbi:hypothetical protein IFM89_031696 [Coptis chinensis]|uniref:Phytocyanin domain-containing protein n=1 Tax=Coptis chinensis TaxID=261450 RepID=A0A835HNE2_9MAGN|nr:hypothetical protein IFM89_031696 [Coptis chinensis]